MFAEHDKHYPRKSGQTSLTTAVANFTKPVTKNNFGPSTNNYVVMVLERLREAARVEHAGSCNFSLTHAPSHSGLPDAGQEAQVRDEGAPEDAEPVLQRDVRLQGRPLQRDLRQDPRLRSLRLRPVLQARPDRRGQGQSGSSINKVHIEEAGWLAQTGCS